MNITLLFGVHHGFKTLANLRNVHTHNHLECLALAHNTEGSGILEGSIRSINQGFIRHRDTQASSTVVHRGDVIGTAKQFEESCRSRGIQICIASVICGCGTFLLGCLRGLVFGFRVQLRFATLSLATRGLEIELQNEESEEQELDDGEGQTHADLHKVGRPVVLPQRNPVEEEEVIKQTTAHVA